MKRTQDQDRKPHDDDQAPPNPNPTPTPTPNPNADPDDGPAPAPVPLSQLYRFATPPDLFVLGVGTLAAVGSGGVVVAFAALLGRAMNELNSPTGITLTTISYFLIIGGATVVAAMAQVVCFTYVADQCTVRLRVAYLSSVLAQDAKWYDVHRSGEVSATLNESIVPYRDATGSKLAEVFQHLAGFVAGVVLGFIYSWQLALVVMGLMPFLVGAGYLCMKSVRARTAAEQRAYSRAGAIADETISSVRTVTSFNAQDIRVKAYEAEATKAADEARHQNVTTAFFTGLVFFVMFTAYGLGYFVGGLLILHDRVVAQETYPLSTVQQAQAAPPFCAVGGVVPLQCYVGQAASGVNVTFASSADVCACPMCGCGCFPNKLVYGPTAAASCMQGGDVLTTFFALLLGSFGLAQAVPAAQSVQVGRVAAHKLFKVIDHKPEIEREGDGAGIPTSTENKSNPTGGGSFALHNVTFAYPSKPDTPVLRGVSITMPPGLRVALVGQSGSGKSTIAQLLLRFYDPDTGSVTLDGIDLRHMDVRELRRMVGLISQEPVLFALDVASNIRLGAPNASIQDVEQAAKAANAHDFVSRFPSGYRTNLGSSSNSQVSGGQKQRIAIARALIRKPRVLVMDEATSALDAVSEAAVTEAVNQLRQAVGTTVILIAHRMETIRNSDKIVVLEQGLVVEEGTHDSLAERTNGVYAGYLRIAGKHTLRSTNGGSSTALNSSSFVSVGSITGTGLGSTTQLGQVHVNVGDERDTENASTKKKKIPTVPLSRALTFSYPERWWYLPGGMSSAITGLAFPAFALCFASVLAALFQVNATDVITQTGTWFVAFAMIGLGNLIFTAVQGAVFGYVNAKATTRARTQTFRAILRNEMGFFDDEDNSQGVLISRLASDAARIKSGFSDRLTVIASTFATLVAGFTIAFTSSYLVALVTLSTFPILVVVGFINAQLSKGSLLKSHGDAETANTVLSEAVSGYKTVQAFNARTTVVATYQELIRKSIERSLVTSFGEGFGFGLGQGTRFFTSSLTLWYGSTLIQSQSITFQDMMRANFGILFSAIAVGQVMTLVPDIAKARAAINSVFALIDRVSKIDWTKQDEGLRPGTVLGDVAFEDVTFTYPSRPEAVVLQNLTLRIPRGTSVALVGPSGSGKSTVVQLLERFYDPDQGRITLDGCDLRSFNLTWLRDQIGLVSQEPILFDASIADNVRVGLPGASMDQIVEACRAANAHDFISNTLSDGYDTPCGGRGGRLSGGQKQRVAIARALVKNPKIMLLDEATSALDEESQRVVQESLDAIVKSSGRTTIVVAHRLSTIRNVDLVAVLDRGVLVEMGSFGELAEAGGAFTTLLRMQEGGGGGEA